MMDGERQVFGRRCRLFVRQMQSRYGQQSMHQERVFGGLFQDVMLQQRSEICGRQFRACVHAVVVHQVHVTTPIARIEKLQIAV